MQKAELERQMADVHSRYTEALVDSQAHSVACEEVVGYTCTLLYISVAVVV